MQEENKNVKIRNGFEPSPDFRPDCPPVCGNCAHWDSELFAWGVMRICHITGDVRQAGDICNIAYGDAK